MPSLAAPGASLVSTTAGLLQHYWSTQQWRLLYRETDATLPPTSLASLQPIAPPSNAMWADPFPVSLGARRFVLFEECTYRFWGRTTGSRGILRAMEYLGGGLWSPPRTILERPYHLSYPFVFEAGGRHYLIPETLANSAIELYEAVEFPWRWRFVRSLLTDVSAVDTTLAEINGTWWMFTCMESRGAPNRDLCLFHTNDPVNGRWIPHWKNPVVMDSSCARMAGNLWFDGTHWIRPGQDCSAGYGAAVKLRRILDLTPHSYCEQALGRLGPETLDGASGVHTFNMAAGLQCSDARRSVERWRLR